MGWLVLRSRWLPRVLGWLLIVGGVSYTLGAFVGYLVSNADLVTTLLTVPATIGELWIMGYLIMFGVSDHAAPHDAPHDAPATDETTESRDGLGSVLSRPPAGTPG